MLSSLHFSSQCIDLTRELLEYSVDVYTSGNEEAFQFAGTSLQIEGQLVPWKWDLRIEHLLGQLTAYQKSLQCANDLTFKPTKVNGLALCTQRIRQYHLQ